MTVTLDGIRFSSVRPSFGVMHFSGLINYDCRVGWDMVFVCASVSIIMLNKSLCDMLVRVSSIRPLVFDLKKTKAELPIQYFITK